MRRLLLLLLFVLIGLCTPVLSQIHPGCDAKADSWYVLKTHTSVACSVTSVTEDRVYFIFLQDPPGALPAYSTHPEFHKKWKLLPPSKQQISYILNTAYNYGDIYVKKTDARIRVIICRTAVVLGELMVVYKRAYQWPDGPERQMLERNFQKQYKKIGVIDSSFKGA